MKFNEWLNENHIPTMGRTSRDHDHYHMYEVGMDGDGATTSMIGMYEHGEHGHDVVNWKVISFDNGHTHFIVGMG